MGKKKQEKTIFEKLSEGQALRDRYGKRFEVDFMDAIKDADKPEQLSANYILGLVVMRQHKAGMRESFINWRRINTALAEKFGPEMVEAFKGFARSRIDSYGLEMPGLDSAAHATAQLLIDQARQQAEKEQAAS